MMGEKDEAIRLPGGVGVPVRRDPPVVGHLGDGILSQKLEGDVGYDLIVSEDTIVPPGGFANIPHNAAVELPLGYWGMIFARSSVNLGGRLAVLPGVIDNGYRGRLFAFAHNLSPEPVTVECGSRICQLVLFPVSVFPLERKEKLSLSARWEDGFGSTGGTNGERPHPVGG